MKYKVGDKIRIVSKKIGNNWASSGDMDKYLGAIMTIKAIVYGDCYRMKEDKREFDGSGWTWHPEMIEGLAEKEKIMTNEQELHELKLRVAELEKKIEGEVDNGWCKEDLEDGDTYFFIDTESNRIGSTFEYRASEDVERYDTANKFTNEEFAQRQMDIDILRRKMQRFSDENGGQEIDWVDKLEAKWCLEVACDNGVMKIALIHYAEYRSPFQVYFATEEIAWQAKKLFEDEILRLYS